MSQTCLLSIPVMPYIKKFLIGKYGAEPILCSQRNLTGRQLRSMIIKNPDGKFDNASPVKVQLRLTGSLWQAREKIKRHANSNMFMLDVFRAAIEGYVNGAHPYLKSRKLAVEKFFIMFDISEDDLSFETVERWFHKRSNIVTGKQLDKYVEAEIEQKCMRRVVRMQSNIEQLREQLKQRDEVIANQQFELKKLEHVIDYLQTTYLKNLLPLPVEE